MLSIFSCAFWPSIYLLWRNVYLDLLPIKKKYLIWSHWVFVAMHRLSFFSCGEWGLLFNVVLGLLTVVASLLQSTVSRHSGFSSCKTWAQKLWLMSPSAQAQTLWLMGLAVPRHVESSQTCNQTHVPCVGRWILTHVPPRKSFCSFLNGLFIYLYFDIELYELFVYFGD